MAPCAAQLGAGRFEVGARREPREEFGHPMHAAIDHRRVEMVRTGDDVGNDLGFRWIWDRRLEDADDRGSPIAKADRSANDVPIALEFGRPESVRQDRRPGRLRAVVSRVKKTAQNRAQAHDFEIRPTDDPCPNDARLAQSDHRELDHGEIAECAQRLDAILQVPNFGHREVGVLHVDAGRTLTQVDEPLLVAVHQRLEEYAVDDAENGSVGANPQGERHDDGQRQPLDASQRPDGETDISEKVG
jgi:hypothetical protein